MGAAGVAGPLLAVSLEIRLVHQRRVGIRGRLLLLQGDQIAGDVLRILGRKPEAGHHSHVLYLQFVAVVRAPAVVQVKDVGQALLFVILGADVLLFIRAVRTRALARVLDPAHEVVVAVLLTHTREIRGKSSALQLVAFADGVAGEAAARFPQLFSLSGVARFVLWRGMRQSGLPTIG